MSEVRRFEIADGPADRLDVFVANALEISRTQAARLVAAKGVMVNGKAGRASYRAESGDVIEIAIPEKAAPRTVEPYDFPLDVPYEDDSLLVVNKPAGLVVHPAPGHWQDTLVNALVARGHGLSSGPSERRGIVHRLDRDTSGLMLVAKTDLVHERLARALEQRKISRVYAAMVWGHIDEAVRVDAPIDRHPHERKRMFVTPGGRPAVTHVRPIARFDATDLVRLELETGRTHQIRVHLAHIGHPVVGDPVYGGGGPRRATGQQQQIARAIHGALDRQALHAAELGFLHPETDREMVLRSDWPDDLHPMLKIAAEDDNLVARPEVLDYLGFFGTHG